MIQNISRRGKFLTLHFESGDRLSLHLRVMGQLLFMPREEALGPGPTDPTLTAEYLKLKLGKRKKAIKETLHDQTVVAGVGNIHSDKMLSVAGVCPGAGRDALSDADWGRLANAIPKVVLWGDADQMTPEEHLRGKGKAHQNAVYLPVYGRGGQPCPTCGDALCRKAIGGRSSTYCPNCQKACQVGSVFCGQKSKRHSGLFNATVFTVL